MCIYDDHKAYARKVRITERMAKLWCDHQKKKIKEIHEAKKCPLCSAHTLEYESGSYEYNEPDYVYCDNDEIPLVDEEGESYLGTCEFATTNIEDYIKLQHGYDFDYLLALNEYGMTGAGVYGGLANWVKHAKQIISEVSA